MNFYDYARGTEYYGQEKIIKELIGIATELKNGVKLNLLFQAQSGYGKTTLAYTLLSFVDPGYKNSFQYIPNRDGEVMLEKDARYHFIDEAHELKVPESLYSSMDSSDLVIMIATNEFDKLKEPMRNRCINFNFVPYTNAELALILQDRFVSRYINLPYEWCLEITSYTRGNPRVAKNLALRIGFLINNYGYPDNVEDLHKLVYEILGTDSKGITEYDRLYLETLEKAGGVAALNLMVGLTNLPKKVILEEIEPFLIMQGLIRVTSKGRSLAK